MALSITSTSTNSTSFTISDIVSSRTISSSDSKNASINYAYGTGINQVTNAASITGTLPSGGSYQIDLFSIDQSTFNSTQAVQFTGVKHFSVFNESSTNGYDFSIEATGTNSCTNLFNGGDGNLLIKPNGSFVYNDPYSGFAVSSSQRYVYLNDSGSGVSYKLFVLGLD